VDRTKAAEGRIGCDCFTRFTQSETLGEMIGHLEYIIYSGLAYPDSTSCLQHVWWLSLYDTNQAKYLYHQYCPLCRSPRTLCQGVISILAYHYQT